MTWPRIFGSQIEPTTTITASVYLGTTLVTASVGRFDNLSGSLAWFQNAYATQLSASSAIVTNLDRKSVV